MLVFAVLAGGVVAVLTHMSGLGVPQSLIAGGGAAGAAFLWANSVIKPPQSS
jgi:small-conductance mechanosensitive channel